MDTYFLVNFLGDVIHAVMVAGLTFLAALFLIPYYFRTRTRIVKPPVQPVPDFSESLKITLPLRLQAYERIVMYMERIQPANLLLRLQKTDLNSQELQLLMIRTIREEFDYNLSQQVYVSATCWEKVRNAREEAISDVNRAALQVDPGSESSALARALFDISLATEQSAITSAISFLKSEVMELMQ
jgi:hypothetical protein